VAVAAEPAHDLQGAVGVGGGLHVDAHEDAVPRPGRHDRREDGQALLDAEVEAHLGELEADVGVEAGVGDALDGLYVRGGPEVRGGAVVHALAEHVERGAGSRGIEGTHGDNGVLERGAGDEAEGHASQEGRGERQASDPATVAQPEEEAAERARQHRQPRRP
jgi:hypothetical protein